ncbi:hypothetical protein FOL47_002753, partial [Perkinsus chesapeaki]
MPASTTDYIPSYWLRTDESVAYTWLNPESKFNIANVKGDGNCLFYAAMVSLRPLQGRLPKQLKECDQENAPTVLHEGSWASQLVADDVQADLRQRGLPPNPTWQQYVNDICTPGCWASDMEVDAIARVLKRK